LSKPPKDLDPQVLTIALAVGSPDIEDIGSAQDDAELETLKVISAYPGK
jgi:hypothetical protein